MGSPEPGRSRWGGGLEGVALSSPTAAWLRPRVLNTASPECSFEPNGLRVLLYTRAASPFPFSCPVAMNSSTNNLRLGTGERQTIKMKIVNF